MKEFPTLSWFFDCLNFSFGLTPAGGGFTKWELLVICLSIYLVWIPAKSRPPLVHSTIYHLHKWLTHTIKQSKAKQSKATQVKEQLNAGPGSGRKKIKAGWKVYLVLTWAGQQKNISVGIDFFVMLRKEKAAPFLLLFWSHHKLAFSNTQLKIQQLILAESEERLAGWTCFQLDLKFKRVWSSARFKNDQCGPHASFSASSSPCSSNGTRSFIASGLISFRNHGKRLLGTHTWEGRTEIPSNYKKGR
jgi:hypothetical protein